MTAEEFEAQAEALRTNVTNSVTSKDVSTSKHVWIFYGIVAISGVLLYKGYRAVSDKRKEVREQRKDKDES